MTNIQTSAMNKKSKRRKIKTFPHPLDSGWSWIVLLAIFTIYVIFGGILRSFGIYMVEFLTDYDTDSSSASLLIGLQFASSGVGGLFSTTVGIKFLSPRQIIMIGGLIGSIGLMINSFAQSIYFFIFSHSILVGLAIGLMNAPCLFSLGKYFDKRKSLANGVAMGGVSTGGLIMGPISRYLIDVYGLKGAFLIIGAIHLNTIVAASLIRPDTFYQVRIKRKSRKISDTKGQEQRSRKISDGKSPEQRTRKISDGKSPEQRIRKISDPRKPESKSLLDDNEQSEGFRPRSNTSDSFSPLARKAMLQRMRSRTESEVVTVDLEPMLYDNNTSVSNSQGDIPGKTNEKNKKFHGYISNEYLFEISTVEIIRTLSDEKMGKDNMNSLSTIVTENNLKRFLRALCDCSIFKNSAFTIFITSYLIGSIGCFYPIVFIPALADFNGISKTKQSLLISISSIVDVFGRTGCGIFADRGIISRKHIIITTLSICGLINCLNSFYTEFWSLCLYSVIYGLLGGTLFAINSSTLHEILEDEKFGQGIGLMTAGQQVTLGVSGPIAGALRDVTGRYDATFYFFAGGNLLAVTLLSIESIYFHFKKKQNTSDQNVNT